MIPVGDKFHALTWPKIIGGPDQRENWIGHASTPQYSLTPCIQFLMNKVPSLTVSVSGKSMIVLVRHKQLACILHDSFPVLVAG